MGLLLDERFHGATAEAARESIKSTPDQVCSAQANQFPLSAARGGLFARADFLVSRLAELFRVTHSGTSKHLGSILFHIIFY